MTARRDATAPPPELVEGFVPEPEPEGWDHLFSDPAADVAEARARIGQQPQGVKYPYECKWLSFEQTERQRDWSEKLGLYGESEPDDPPRSDADFRDDPRYDEVPALRGPDGRPVVVQLHDPHEVDARDSVVPARRLPRGTRTPTRDATPSRDAGGTSWRPRPRAGGAFDLDAPCGVV